MFPPSSVSYYCITSNSIGNSTIISNQINISFSMQGIRPNQEYEISIGNMQG